MHSRNSRFLTILVLTLFVAISIPVIAFAMVNSGDVSGTVTYTGSNTESHTIYIGVHPSIDDPPEGGDTSVASPGGPYTVSNVADGTYYVSAYLDLDDSGGEPGEDEPGGWYDANDDGTPDTITVSGGNVTGVDITFGDVTHAPEIQSMDGVWQQIGGAVSTIRAERVDLDFYSDNEHNTPAVLFSNYENGLTLMKWDGGDSQAWKPEGNEYFAPGGTFIIALDINNSDVPYAAYSNEPNDFKANVEHYIDDAWTSVGSADFSPGAAYNIDMQLKSDGSTPVVAFREGSSNSEGSAMTLGSSGWEYIGSPKFGNANLGDIRLVLDSYDVPYVVFQASGNLWVMKYTGAGTTGWEYVGGSSAIVSNAYDISIAINSADVVYIAFKDNANNGKATVMKHSGDLADPWQTVGTAGFSTCSSGAYYTNIAINHDNVPYIVFHSYCDTGAVVMKYTGEGTTGWETVGDAGFSDGNVLYPVINFNNDDTPFVAFIASSGRSPYVMRYEDHPAITETDVTMSEDGDPIPFDLSLRGYDKDGDELTWAIAEQGMHGTAAVESVLGSTGVVTATFAYTPTANYNGMDSFVVQLDDGTDTVTATVNVTIDPVNDAPVAKFANQTVATDETVTLDGTLSTDVDGEDIVEYTWAQTGGTPVSFTDNISQTTFIAPSATDTLTFTLTVTDTGGLSDTHEGTIWVVEGDSSATVPPDSETTFAPEGASFTLTVPAGGVSEDVSLIYTGDVGGYTPPANQQFFSEPFGLTAYVDGEEQSDFTFEADATITLNYSDSQMYGMLETSLNLQYWDGSGWSSDGITFVSQDVDNNEIVFILSHLTDFVYLVEDAYMVHLPLVQR